MTLAPTFGGRMRRRVAVDEGVGRDGRSPGLKCANMTSNRDNTELLA